MTWHLAVVGLSLALASCAMPQIPWAQRVRDTASVSGVTAALRPEPVVTTSVRIYRVGPGDELEVRLKGLGQPIGRLIVTEAGRAELPRIGDTAIAGRSLDEIAALMEGKDAAGVEVNLLNPGAVVVTGEVARPGTLDYRAGLTLKDVLEARGGLTHRADLMAFRIRPRHGEPIAAQIDLALPVLPGDVIEVPQRYF